MLTLGALYYFSNAIAYFNWFFLIAMPDSKMNKFLDRTKIIVIILGLIHGILFFYGLYTYAEFTDFLSLEGLHSLYDRPLATIISWEHMLAYDLVAGMWMAKDAKRRGLTRKIMVPVLFFVSYMGPIAFVPYMVIRWMKGQKIENEDEW